jgi:hypothetical protein
MTLILGTNSIKDTGYNVANSLRFNKGSSDYLNKTNGTSTLQTKFTFSSWFKRSEINESNDKVLMGEYTDNNNRIKLQFKDDDFFEVFMYGSGSTQIQVKTTRKFRDPSAWMHIVVAIDTTQGTASNRVKIYVNGVQETSFSISTYPSEDLVVFLNANSKGVAIGNDDNNGSYFDGYMSEVVFIDGQQLAPTSFGEFDEDSPTIWKPIDVSGLTFGNNGFYLDFENSGSLGADVSGNGNNFTVNNLTSIDQTTDTCTNNFATFNPLSKNDSGTITFSQGNLFVAHSGSDSNYNSYSTIGLTQGKWYAEFKYEATSGGADLIIGVSFNPENLNRQGQYLGSDTTSFGYWSSIGDKYYNGSHSSFGNSYAVGDIVGVALDLDNNKLYFSKNGTFQNSGDPTSGATGTGSAFDLTANETYFMCCNHATTTTRTTSYSANFGSPYTSISSGNSDGNGYGNFEYAVPSGYYSLNSKNLAEFG